MLDSTSFAFVVCLVLTHSISLIRSCRQQFHCDQCGICRLGGAENFRHCQRCGMCLSIPAYEDHNCRSGSGMSDCPICMEVRSLAVYLSSTWLYLACYYYALVFTLTTGNFCFHNTCMLRTLRTLDAHTMQRAIHSKS